MAGPAVRVLRYGAIGLLILVALAVFTLALPVRTWRTGRLPAPPLTLLPPEAIPPAPTRIWIDTDAACGVGPRTDPDDCLAILLLARDSVLDIVGISTVFGNAPLATTDSVARDLAVRLAAGRRRPIPVFRGAAGPTDDAATGPTAAASALQSALEAGPLTVVALVRSPTSRRP